MAFKFVLYLTAFFIFIAAISYSDSGVSASIQVLATVEQPLGFSSFSLSESKNQEIENSISGIEYNSENELLIRIPARKSAVCIIETIDGRQFYNTVSEDLLPVTSIDGKSDIMPAISQITVIYTEN